MKLAVPLLLVLTLIPAAAGAAEDKAPAPPPPAATAPADPAPCDDADRVPRVTPETATSRAEAERMDVQPTSWSNVKALWGN